MKEDDESDISLVGGVFVVDAAIGHKDFTVTHETVGWLIGKAGIERSCRIRRGTEGDEDEIPGF